MALFSRKPSIAGGPSKGILARQISSSILIIISLLLLAIAIGGGYFFYHLIYDEPITDGLQNIFRLIFSAMIGIILTLIAGIGLTCGIIACYLRPRQAK